MSDFYFSHPIEVRYGDLDPQGHVNNAKYLTYMEQARIAYIRHLELWPGGGFDSLGVILADVQVTYKRPILFGQPVLVKVRVVRLGNKSLTMEYCLEDARDDSLLSTGSSVLVTYDYRLGKTIPIPAEWHTKIRAFEHLPERSLDS